jgi:hypothetical protein
MKRCSLRRALLLAPPILGLIGCVGGPQLTQLNGNVNGLIPSAVRPQKADDVVPAAAINLPPTTLADGTVAVRAIAYVNNAPIFESEWREAVNQHVSEYADLPEPQRTERKKFVEQRELENLIDRELVIEIAMTQLKKMKASVSEELQKEAAKEADKRMREIKTKFNIQSDEQMKQLFASQGASVEGLRRQIERSFIQMEYMKNVIMPKLQAIPLSEIRDYYEKHLSEFQEQDRVKWQALFVDAGKFPNRPAAQQYAEQVAAQLRGGADFAATAKKLRDSGLNILLSDTGIGEKPGEIQPAELEPAVFRLRAGEVSAPVELPGGFYIARAVERNYAGRRPLNVETQSDIRKRLMNSMFEREYRRLVEEMKLKAVIQKVGMP